MLNAREYNAYMVTGEGGIGKTNFCRKVLATFLRKHTDTKVYWICDLCFFCVLMWLFLHIWIWPVHIRKASQARLKQT